MADERCAPGHHIGEDQEGRCSWWGGRDGRPSRWRVLLTFVAVTPTVVLTIQGLLFWWLG